MYCGKCGNEIKTEAFCPVCGNKIENKAKVNQIIGQTSQENIVPKEKEAFQKKTRRNKVLLISIPIFILVIIGAYFLATNLNKSTTASVQVSEQNNNLFRIRTGSKYGYINDKGDIIIKPKYTRATEFTNEGAIGCIDDTRWVAIKRTGETEIFKDIKFNKIYLGDEKFSEGLLLVLVDNLYGFVDINGNFIIKPQFKIAYSFMDGLAPVWNGEKWGYIDKTGKYIIPPVYRSAGHFHEGLAIVSDNFIIDVAFTGYQGYVIDKTGTKVIDPMDKNFFIDGEALSADLFLATIGKYDYGFYDGLLTVENKAGDGKFFSIDKYGIAQNTEQFDYCYRFLEGLAAVKVGGKWGFVDKAFNKVIPPQYEEAHGFSEGLAAVKLNGKWGFIDKTGKMVIPPKINDIFILNDFHNGLALVNIDKDNYKQAYIDKNGKYVWIEK